MVLSLWIGTPLDAVLSGSISTVIWYLLEYHSPSKHILLRPAIDLPGQWWTFRNYIRNGGCWIEWIWRVAESVRGRVTSLLKMLLLLRKTLRALLVVSPASPFTHVWLARLLESLDVAAAVEIRATLILKSKISGYQALLPHGKRLGMGRGYQYPLPLRQDSS